MRYKNNAKERTNGRDTFCLKLVQCFVNRDFSSVQTAVPNTHVIRSGVCAGIVRSGTYYVGSPYMPCILLSMSLNNIIKYAINLLLFHLL